MNKHMQKNNTLRHNKLSIREAAVELQNAGIVVPVDIQNAAYAKWVRVQHAKLVLRNAPTPVQEPKQEPKQEKPKQDPEQKRFDDMNPREKRDFVMEASLMSRGDFFKKTTKWQVSELIALYGGRDSFGEGGSKQELMKKLAETKLRYWHWIDAELDASTEARRRLKQKWSAKADSIRSIGIEVDQQHERTGMFPMEIEAETKWRKSSEPVDMATGKWVTDILRELANEKPCISAGHSPSQPEVSVREFPTTKGRRFEFKLTRHTTSTSRHQASDYDDGFMDRVMEANLRARHARAKRDADFVKKSHRKARGQRDRAIAPAMPAMPAVTDLLSGGDLW